MCVHQLAKKELAYAEVAQRRYEAGPEEDVQSAAEISYGIALREIGRQWQDSNALAMAAEALMNSEPWNYQNVSLSNELYGILRFLNIVIA